MFVSWVCGVIKWFKGEIEVTQDQVDSIVWEFSGKAIEKLGLVVGTSVWMPASLVGVSSVFLIIFVFILVEVSL